MKNSASSTFFDFTSILISKWFIYISLLLSALVFGFILVIEKNHSILIELINFFKSIYPAQFREYKVLLALLVIKKMLLAFCVSIVVIYFSLKWIVNNLNKLPSTPINTELSNNNSMKKNDYVFIIILLVASFLLRYKGLNNSLWQDEIGVYFTFIKPGLIKSIIPTSSMGCHPLVQLLSGMFVKLFGFSDIKYRIVCFVFGISTSVVFYFVLRNITKKKFLSFLFSFLVVINPFHIYYSWQMRGYIMIMFLGIFALYTAYKFLFYNRDKYLFLLTMWALVYTHLYSLLLIISIFILFIILNVREITTKSNRIISFDFINKMNIFIILFLLVFISYLPHIPMIFMITTGSTSGTEASINNIFVLLKSIPTLLGIGDAYYLFGIFSFILMYLLSLKKNKITDEKVEFNNFLISTLLITLILFSVISLFDLITRYTSILFPALILIFSLSAIIILEQQDKSIIKILTLVTLIGFTAINILGINKSIEEVQPYKSAVQYVTTNFRGLPIISTSLGKDEVSIYNNQIIKVSNLTQLDSVVLKNKKVVSIISFENFAGKEGFNEDLPVLQKIKHKAIFNKTFAGESPVNVYVSNFAD